MSPFAPRFGHYRSTKGPKSQDEMATFKL